MATGQAEAWPVVHLVRRLQLPNVGSRVTSALDASGSSYYRGRVACHRMSRVAGRRRPHRRSRLFDPTTYMPSGNRSPRPEGGRSLVASLSRCVWPLTIALSATLLGSCTDEPTSPPATRHRDVPSLNATPPSILLGSYTLPTPFTTTRQRKRHRHLAFKRDIVHG